MLSFDVTDLGSVKLNNQPPSFDSVGGEIVKSEVLMVSVDDDGVTIEDRMEFFESFHKNGKKLKLYNRVTICALVSLRE
jgi:predicted RNA-binding protein